jgi:hypothetical protein
MQCQKKKSDGSRCKARALCGKKRCALHSDPRKAAELGRRGGRRRTRCNPEALRDFLAPKNAEDLQQLLAESIVEVRNGKIDPRVANSISYLGMGFLRVIEVSNLENRLNALEELRTKDDRRLGLGHKKNESKRS